MTSPARRIVPSLPLLEPLEPRLLLSAVTAYEVWRNTINDAGSAVLIADNLPQTSFEDTTAAPGPQYYYWTKVETTESISAALKRITDGFIMGITLTCPTTNVRGETRHVEVKVEVPDGGYWWTSGDIVVRLVDDDPVIDDLIQQKTVHYDWQLTSWSTVVPFDVDMTTSEPFYEGAAEVYADATQIPDGSTPGILIVTTSPDIDVQFLDSPTSPPGGLTASDGQYTDKVGISWSSATGTSGFSASDVGWAKISPPTNVQASDDTYTDKVQVSWTAPAGATRYDVWRNTSNDPASNSRIADDVVGTTYNDTSATPGVTYYYWVSAETSYDSSSLSTSDSGRRLGVPSAPSSLAATPVPSSQINLSWQDNSSNENGFKIERKTGVSGTWSQIGTTGADITAYSDAGLSAGTMYYYRVRAHNAAGNSGYSNEANGTTQPVNQRPSTSIATPSGPQSGNVSISYTLSDADSDTCTIAVQYSPDAGSNWSAATAGTDGDGTSGLLSSPSGTPHTYAWDSKADLGLVTNNSVRIMITPSDAGGAGSEVPTNSFTVVNLMAPSMPDLPPGFDSGVDPTDDITNVTTPTITIDALQSGITGVAVYRNGTYIDDATFVSGTTYSYSFASGQLLEDNNQIMARNRLEASLSGDSAVLAITVDKTAPGVPMIALDPSSDTGPISDDYITDVRTPTFGVSGGAPYARLYRDGVLVTGEYAALPVTLSEQPYGTFEFTAAAVDTAGNVSAPSHPLTVTIAQFPAAPAMPDLLSGDDRGVSPIDNITNISTPTIHIEAPAPGPAIQVFNNGAYVGDATLVSGTTFAYAFAEGQLAEGLNTITARSLDGTVPSYGSPGLAIVLDTAPTIQPYAVGVGSLGGFGHGQDVEVSDGIAYVANGGGEVKTPSLQIFDVSNPIRPAPIATYAFNISSPPFGVATVGHVAYVAIGYFGLQIIDVSDPFSPALLRALDTPGDARDVAVCGHTAYVADSGSGLQVIDVTDPENPTFLNSYVTPAGAAKVVVLGSVAYVLASSTLYAIDVSDPTELDLLGLVSVPHIGMDLDVAGVTAYVADGSSVQIIDVTDPHHPGLLAPCTFGPASCLDVEGTTLYSAGYRGLQAIDVSSPAAPVLLGSLQRNYIQSIAVDRTTGYLAGWGGADYEYELELSTVDLPNLAAPVLYGGPYHIAVTSMGSSIARVGTTACLSGYGAEGLTGLVTADISNPYVPRPSGFLAMEYIMDIAMEGTRAYVISSTDTGPALQIIDVTDAAHPAVIGPIGGLSISAWHLAVQGTMVYLLGESMQIVDVSNPSAPHLDGLVPYRGMDVAVNGTIAYIAGLDSGLLIIDVSDPDNPFPIDSYDTPGSAYGVQVVGNIAYVADWTSLQIIDVSVPSNPVLMSEYHAPSLVWYPGRQDCSVSPFFATGVVVEGSTACTWVTYDSLRFRVIDVSDPLQPSEKGIVRTGSAYEGVYNVAVVGPTVYVVTAAGGLQVMGGLDPEIDLLLPSDTGALQSDNITRDGTATFWVGGGAPYARVYRDGALVSGEYEHGLVTLGQQPEGTHQFTTRSVDAAGNVSAPSQPLTVTFDYTAPSVTGDTLNAGSPQRSTISSLAFSFDEDVSASLKVGDLTLHNDTTGQFVDLSALTAADLTYDGPSNTATWDLRSLALQDGCYTATLTTAAVGDLAGNPLQGGDYVMQFHRMLTDANGDARVDSADLAVWQRSYDPLGRNVNTPATGDWDGDGDVDSADLAIWQRNYNPLGLSESLPLLQVAASEQWVPYVPSTEQTDISVSTDKGVTTLAVLLTFPDAGYRVTDWGPVPRQEDDFSADAQIEDWTGAAALVITPIVHDYDLGQLAPGGYSFTFKVWGHPVETMPFTVMALAPGDGNGDAAVDSVDLAIWQQHYDPLGKNQNTPAMGNWDGDSDIDSADLALWQRHYDPLGQLSMVDVLALAELAVPLGA